MVRLRKFDSEDAGSGSAEAPDNCSDRSASVDAGGKHRCASRSTDDRCHEPRQTDLQWARVTSHAQPQHWWNEDHRSLYYLSVCHFVKTFQCLQLLLHWLIVMQESQHRTSSGPFPRYMVVDAEMMKQEGEFQSVLWVVHRHCCYSGNDFRFLPHTGYTLHCWSKICHEGLHQRMAVDPLCQISAMDGCPLPRN